MPNITTNHAITYTKFINKKVLKKPVSEIPTSKTSFSLPLISLREGCGFCKNGYQILQTDCTETNVCTLHNEKLSVHGPLSDPNKLQTNISIVNF